MIIKKIFDGVFDNEIHLAFLKFGRGEYKDRYLLNGKKQGKGWAIKAGGEYVNFLVRKCLEHAPSPVAIKGIIVTTVNIKDGEELGFDIKKKSNFQGVRKLQIETEVEPSRILELMERYPLMFFALSFKGDNFVLKIKAKAPMTGKPKKAKENGSVADFCSLKTDDKSLVDELFFGIGDFNEVLVNHMINVTDIVYPADINELEPAEIREQSKRKGVVVRKINVDGIEKTSEAEFVA